MTVNQKNDSRYEVEVRKCTKVIDFINDFALIKVQARSIKYRLKYSVLVIGLEQPKTGCRIRVETLRSFEVNQDYRGRIEVPNKYTEAKSNPSRQYSGTLKNLPRQNSGLCYTLQRKQN